ncbi:MAG: hypothetical protein JSV45_16500 [Chromatiales bacterium]|nr:MAG: hypothetical protein JSV45_16500 [Chromatiales bacterium]
MNRRECILALLFLPVSGRAEDAETRQRRCEWLKARVRHLDARLRAGHRVGEGRRLRARRRELARERFRACR